MISRFLSVAFILFAICSVSLSSTTLKTGVIQKKSLPLDGIAGKQMKTRENSQYLSGRIIIKLMPGETIEAISSALSPLSVSRTARIFNDPMASRSSGNVDLSRFYYVDYSSPVDVFAAAEELSALAEVQYAEPQFIYPLSETSLFTPNDPSFGSQWGLTKIQAPLAWDITQGDTSVVIAIVDSGVETGHPDLAVNIWNNPGETGLDGSSNDKRFNNIDDDGNGYVDDWRGWDFGGADYNNVVPDNNPNPTGSNNAHGTHVAGIASAATNNNTGVAGVGFKCRLLPVKTSADNDTRAPGGLGYIIAGYEGVAYAAFMGADVMNMSWGGSGGSQFEQDIVNYATQQGTLLVGAAGNGNSSASHYPSSYNNVISVAATNSADIRSSFSNYGIDIDVCAPGSSILSTVYPSSYATWDGTSMASPFVAGLAGLVKSAHPTYTGLQLGELMRMTCDNIDGINPSYAGLLGRGRINASRALTESPSAVRARNFLMRDSLGGNNNGNPEPNETIDLYFTFTNYLSPTTNASAVLTTTAPGLTVINGMFNIGVLGTLDTIRNTATPFRIQLSGSVTPGLIATLKLTLTDGSQSDTQFYTLVINPTYQNHNINQVTVTMTNNGRIGYNNFPTNSQGVGFLYPSGGANHLFEGGLIIGNSATRLLSNVRNPGGTQDNDFLSSQIYNLQTPGVISNQDGSTVFSDSSAPLANRLGIQVKQYTYAFADSSDDDYVLVRYDIRNLTSTTISGLYVGQFFDWDIANYITNRTAYDPTRSLAYAWDQNTPTAPYIGMRALDSAAGVRGLVNDGNIVLDRAGKWGWISGGIGQASAGPQDIHTVISSGPYTIGGGATKMVSFAMVGGATLVTMQANADAAKAKWEHIRLLVGVEEEREEVPAAYKLAQNYPNPFNPSTTIRYAIPQAESVTLQVFDILGRHVSTSVDEVMPAGEQAVQFNASGLASGMYYYRMQSGRFSETRKLILLR